MEDDGIKGMLRDEYNRCLELLDQVRKAMNNYPRGKLVVKKIKARGRIYEYHHLQWREGARVLSRHIPNKEIPEIQKMIEEREAYRINGLKLEKRLEYLGRKKTTQEEARFKIAKYHTVLVKGGHHTDAFDNWYGVLVFPAELQILLSLSTLKYGIVSTMKKSLLETNPHLQDASKREKALTRNVETSSAVEGIRVKRDAVSGRFIPQTGDLKAAVKSSKSSR